MHATLLWDTFNKTHAWFSLIVNSEEANNVAFFVYTLNRCCYAVGRVLVGVDSDIIGSSKILIAITVIKEDHVKAVRSFNRILLEIHSIWVFMLARDKNICITMHWVELEGNILCLGCLCLIGARRRNCERIVSICTHTDVIWNCNTFLQNIIILLWMHGGDWILSYVSLFSSLALYYNCVIAFVIVNVLARVFVMINNDAQTLPNCLSRLESAVTGC